VTNDVVDVHSHLYPRSYIERLKSRAHPPQIVGEQGAERFVIFPGERGRLMGRDHWDVDEKLGFMDREGISQSVVSLGNPWLDPVDGLESVDIARALNDEFAHLENQTSGRVVGMGVLPNHTVEAAVAALAEIASTPTLHGVITGRRICGLRLDDNALDPVWQTLSEAELPLFVHPHYTVGADELGGFGHALPVAVGFPLETTIALTRLVFGGVLERFPRLRILVAHGGGTLPYLVGRLNAGWRSDDELYDRLPNPPLQQLQRLYLDTVLYHPIAVRAAADLVGPSQLVFGSDHPFSVADPAANLEAVRLALDEEGRKEVLHLSARALFRLPSPAAEARTSGSGQPAPMRAELASHAAERPAFG
jgi:aminocarboxymuconate-semialdehyde decarboxylase